METASRVGHAECGLGESLSPTRDRLISLIYGGAVERPPWRRLLVALAERLNCRNAGIVLRLSRQGTPPLAVWGRPLALDEITARRIQATHSHLGHLDPLRNALSFPGAINTLDEVISRDALHESPFYREVLAPYGFERMLGMYVSEPRGWEGNIGVVNGLDRPDFGAEDKELLLGLRHHLEQSLAIFAQISNEQAELEALFDTLDRQTIATAILNDSGSVLRLNGAAKRLLGAGAFSLTSSQNLFLSDRSANCEFQQILIAARSATRGKGISPFVQAMRIDSMDDSRLGILVRTIEPLTPYVSESGPAIIVYMAGNSSPRTMERLVSQLFDLTPSEAHLATLLATGYSLSAAADKLKLTENTVRTYCKTILNKVGVNRQADLVRMILCSVAVLG